VKDDRLYLIHILECADRIADYTRGGREEFLSDTKTQDAVIRNFEIIGEAAKRVSDGVRGLAPDIPWRRIGGFRDILIHQYEGVDLHAVWLVVERELPSLKRSIEHVLAQLASPEDGGS